MDERIDLIRRNWNERTPVHAESDFYDVASFRAGRMTLSDIEVEEVGPVDGKSLLHLQCHFGLDTMSWSRLGAAATGVDIAEAAIELARDLAGDVGLDTRFIRANVYDLPQLLNERFDVVYTALGALCWLPDIERWAQLVARYLKPGGTFYILDIHPASLMFEPVGEANELRPAWSYFHDPEGMRFEGGVPSYAGSTPISTPSHEWQHSLSDIVNALIGVGLTIEFLNEFPMAPYQAFPQMRLRNGWWRLPDDHPPIPLMFSIRALN